MTTPRSDADRQPAGILFWSLWYLASLTLVILAPSFLKLREHVWDLPAEATVQSLILGLGFLTFALLIQLADRLLSPRGIAWGLVGIILCFAVPGVLLSRSTLPASRSLFIVGAGTAIVLAALPHLLASSRARWGILAVLILGAASVAVVDRHKPVMPATTTAHTEYYNVKFKPHPSLAIRGNGKTRAGGAIARLGDGFLLVNGRAEFYRLNWVGDRDSLEAVRLPLVAPLNLDEFVRDQPNPATAAVFRITDLAVDERAGAPKIYVAHRYWNAEKHCVTTRVSATTLPGPSATEEQPPGWQTVFESDPCLSLGTALPQVAPLEEGGALAIHPTQGLLLSLGDNGFDGLDGEKPFAQREDVSYGKILRLDLAGGAKVVSMGHRNPQGMTVDANGRIWETEHGPQGGDEVNLIESGSNYGWPLATYGTEYGIDYWPLAKTALNHGSFHEPLYAFVPSLGISQLISVGAKRFPMWGGDLLVGSLRRQSLYRLRVRDDRLSYVETIFVGERVRDLAEGADGRILLWTDTGKILSVSPAPVTLSGRYIFETRCAACHEPPHGETQAAAPSLLGVVTRDVASDRKFQYSEALRQLTGNWNPERLDHFIENPGAYAPGTMMMFGGIPDQNQRRVLIEYLEKDYQGVQAREGE